MAAQSKVISCSDGGSGADVIAIAIVIVTPSVGRVLMSLTVVAGP